MIYLCCGGSPSSYPRKGEENLYAGVVLGSTGNQSTRTQLVRKPFEGRNPPLQRGLLRESCQSSAGLLNWPRIAPSGNTSVWRFT
jgi:hypothetical protein